jgi:biotin-(acetyl-CoA carboxylase) ligase
VYACLALPFTIGLVVKCGVNIATDAIAIVATSFELAAQVDENEKTAKLIELLDTYEKNCATYYEQIQTHYDTVNTNLEAYKNSNNPTARAAHSTIVHDTNILLINLISQNC